MLQRRHGLDVGRHLPVGRLGSGHVGHGPQHLVDIDLDVKPDQANQELHSYATLQEHTKITSFEPHLHAPGMRMCLEAIWGFNIQTLTCAGYDHNWVRGYDYDDDHAPPRSGGLIAGALSMAAGEYVSVSSQADVERADLDPRMVSRLLFGMVNSLTEWYRPGGPHGPAELGDARRELAGLRPLMHIDLAVAIEIETLPQTLRRFLPVGQQLAYFLVKLSRRGLRGDGLELAQHVAIVVGLDHDRQQL